MKNRDLNGLLTFQVVVREGSFSAAARQLGLTPGAISRSIGQLERAVGVRLFNRTTVEFSLTAEGRRLASHVCDKLEMLEDSLAEFNSENRAPQGLLRVSLTNSYGKNYVIPRLGEFLSRYPDISLEIGLNDNRQTLIEEGFDVGTCYGSPDQSAYISRVVCQPRLLLVASPDYLERHGVPRRPDELAEHNCVNVSIGAKGPGAWLFQQRDVEEGASQLVRPNGRIMITDQIEGVLNAALAGLGLTVVHVRAALPHLESGRLKTLMNDYRIDSEVRTRDIHVFFPHRAQIAPRVRAFVDFLVEDEGDDATDCTIYSA
ncbi:LysR family transcriptional regulator [Sphingobium sp. JS3065]|uniref:LysR family transcriptional regulator n=1 Tax=Sphingobium sp. JS3065 TaxID=2970925 RepID=UPI0022656D00|nr:LysR family transcriptional regulator [Sphingobium sp. JS3065]UZW57369.1 LysR family transcriptional regulator [Sphingobium sp. JS3065]